MNKDFNLKEYQKDCAKFLGGECSLSFFKEEYTKENIQKSNNFSLFRFPNNPTLMKSANSIQGLNFDSDWNWIMEVYSKIREVIILLPMNGIEDSITPLINARRPIISAMITGNKEAVAQAIWEFLKWYNEANKN